MCTAIMIKNKGCLFGRNMDIEKSFGERFIKYDKIKGTGIYSDNTPLFADGMNESGLAVCGLNFKGYARFENTRSGIPAWDFIRWLLLNFSSVSEAEKSIGSFIINSMPVNEALPVPTLHWMLGDKTGACAVIESTEDGIHFYDNPYCVLTNNPTFPQHLLNLEKYRPDKMENLPDGAPSLTLPGDFSSASRFVKGAYLVKNVPKLTTNADTIRHFFSILESVKMVNGCVSGGMHTIYSCCMDLEKGEYHFKREE